MMENLDDFARAYIDCALCSSYDADGDDPIGASYDIADIDRASLGRMLADCAKFQRDNNDAIQGDYEQAGHDFWLTRNGHGAGFWDGDWEEPFAAQLDTAARAFGEVHLYVGYDGQVYQGENTIRTHTGATT